MAGSYYNSNYTGAQIDAAIALIRAANLTSEQLATLAGVTGPIQTQLDEKLDSNSDLNPAKLSSAVSVAKGGTGATSAANARENLGLTTQNLIFVPKDGSANITLKVQVIP